MNFSSEQIASAKQKANEPSLPYKHIEYLNKIKDQYNFYPKTIYDIGSCVLHWAKEANKVWNSEIILFDAFPLFEEVYKDYNYQYHIDLLSDQSDKELTFYYHETDFGGNSYYKENPKYGVDIFKPTVMRTKTIDDIVKARSFNKPDMIKIDVQGAELDVLKGAEESLKTCQHIIIELRKVEYNLGAPETSEVVSFLEFRGFKNIGEFYPSFADGDYHFMRDRQY